MTHRPSSIVYRHRAVARIMPLLQGRGRAECALPCVEGGTMPQAGDVLVSRYTLESRLGAGAAAEVWRARDERLGRMVAIKILRPQYVSDAAARTRFEQEARAAAGLSHPNVVDVYDYGATDDTVFIAMMYIDGEDLKRY